MSTLDEALAANGLAVLGGFYPNHDDQLDAGTVLLIGPDGGNFWPILTQSNEWTGGTDDPVDRYSARVLSDIAKLNNGRVLFPFGGPPYHPFYSWALRSGLAWASPVALLVHATQGLFVSYRGALLLPGRAALPEAAPCPCDGCSQPCLTACPVGALGDAGYDVPLCHDYLNSAGGRRCMDNGCQVRGACPVGQNLRPDTQSAYHMQRFHK